MKVIDKYLARYSEIAGVPLPRMPRRYKTVTVIPCADESDFLLQTPGGQSHLLVVVVNEAVGKPLAGNRQLLHQLACPQDVLVHLSPRQSGDVLVINRTNGAGAPVPVKQGVGLARKVGLDVALALFRKGIVESPWLRTTDADVVAETSYFEPIDETAGSICYPFAHVPSAHAAINAAHELYEIELRYFVQGLAWAGSPYAFHTIGSTLVTHAEVYAGVRGMPKRSAGEDFHYLNKASKIAPIMECQREPLHIVSRRSARAPFGTGQKTEEIRVSREQGQPFCTYDGRCFLLLQLWLQKLNLAGQTGELSLGHSELGEMIAAIVSELGVLDRLRALIGRYESGQALARQFELVFDALQTRRFVRLGRERFFADPPWRDALGTSSDITQAECLKQLRGGLPVAALARMCSD